MSRLSNFKEFYLKVVLPNTLSYKNYFNEGNFDKNMNDLIKKYQESYGFNPFEDSISLKDLDIKPIDNIFEDYSNSKGSGVPRAIINTHYRKFLTYQEDIHFENLQELINRINEAFRKDNFIEKFQRKRTEFNGNSRVASNDVIFGDVRDNYWTINKGSEKELQYHINNDGKYIGYGLGFNAQPSQNNHSPMEYVIPFVKSFINNRIYDKLQDYQFVNSSLEDLKNISYGDFILFGKKIELKEDKSIEGIKLLELIYDLEGKQFEAYKLIFSNANLIKENKMNIENEIQKYTDLLHYKPQIILQGPPGTGKTREAKRIAKALLGLGENDSLEGNEQFKLIQFHPSYSYEDFVRGIVAKPNEEGNGIVYTAENKILGTFAKEAFNNWHKAQQSTQTLKEEEVFEAFIEHIKEELAQSEDYKYPLTEAVYLFDADDKRFKYKGDNWEVHSNGLNMNYAEIKRIIESGVRDRQGVTKLTTIGGQARQHASYFLRIVEKYYEFRENYKPTVDKIPLKNYVLIIDEINRANLSAVLGELIYALEYRGEAVQSMYAIEGENNLILPPNLYIIGTMNTADRSVGHIDYAIRRRFAFVNVLPNELEKDFHKELFRAVSELFISNYDEYISNPDIELKRALTLSNEFKSEDVWLGHSYFITKNTPIDIRWEYEIKPILLEYIKDGILINDIKIGEQMQKIKKIVYENNAS